MYARIRGRLSELGHRGHARHLAAPPETPTLKAKRGVRDRAQASALVVATLAVGGVLVVAGTVYWHGRNSSDATARFAAAASEQAGEMESTLLRYGDLVAGSAGLFHSNVVTRNQYADYLGVLGFGTMHYPGLLGVGLVQLERPGQVSGLLQTLRSNGIDVSKVVPSGHRSHYCLMSYADWSGPTIPIPIYGYDLCTYNPLRKALWNAANAGQPYVFSGSSLPGVFSQDFIMIRAVYGGLPRAEPERHRHVTGWVIAFVNGPALIGSLVGLRSEDMQLRLYSEFGASRTLIVQHPTSARAAGPWAAKIPIKADGSWLVALRPLPGSHFWQASDVGPGILLLSGLLAVAALAGLLGSLTYARRRALRLVDRATRSLRTSEERFRTLAGAAPIGILETSGDAVADYVNRRLGEIVGRPDDVLLGRGWVDSVHPEDRSSVLRLAAKAQQSRQDIASTFRVVRPSGEIRHVRMLAASKGAQAADGYVVTVEDVTEEMRAREALVYQTLHDPLTGLPNRNLFLSSLDDELVQCRRGSSSIAVLFLDLDRFKLVNDSFGHAVGDELLIAVAERLRPEVRGGELLARLGGDEFTVIIRDVAVPADATAAANRLLRALAPRFSCSGHSLTITASIGIVLPEEDATAATLLRDADTAMYHAKDAGRNRVEVFVKGLHDLTLDRFTVESELRRAVELDEFRLYYQPIVEPSRGAPVAAEALIRWNHPQRGIVAPMEFIPIAEECGLIDSIGKWVLETAIAQLRSWDDDLSAPKVRVLSVNVSARQLAHDDFADWVQTLLVLHGIEPDRICIEVTESVLVDDGGAVRATLESLHALGLRVSVDDFGTGYSSLAYLHSLPVTSVKVDRSFIERMGGSDDSTPVVAAIVEMAHALGLRTIAEGVSEESHRCHVVDAGCDLAQGFLWSTPVPADELADWWRSGPRLSPLDIETIAHAHERVLTYSDS